MLQLVISLINIKHYFYKFDLILTWGYIVVLQQQEGMGIKACMLLYWKVLGELNGFSIMH